MRSFAYSLLLSSFLMLLTLAPSVASSAQELLIEDFESEGFDGWSLTGTAFGDGPAQGALQNQMNVFGYRGSGLASSFHGGDATVGSATSRPFEIKRDYLAFLIGGGNDAENLGISLLVDGKVVRSATGEDSEDLLWQSWDVSELKGMEATVRIFDSATGGWGHVSIDQIVQLDSKPGRFDVEYHAAKYRQSANYMQEPLRPQFHYSPEINWMNDPNGLVFLDGEYHLFFQYNPAGNEWGHMSWGHAVSKDLIHWEHLPLAIPEVDGIMAFSGCCVVDHNNTTRFAKEGQAAPPIVAIYTGHGKGKQVQHLAYSNDKGRTWSIYEGNPVIDIGESDFRDPKVFWHEATDRWVMVISLAVEKVVVFYGSKDLKEWNELSRFGPAGTENKPNWECPDLFELPVENEDGKQLWVLEVDMGSGSIAGGSGGEYFVGHFDGTEFTATQESRWVDFGRDFYAPVSWSDIPQEDGRRIWIGWFNNWETCLLPTFPWRSSMSVPRTLSLRKVEPSNNTGEYVLVQRPVKELEALRSDPVELDSTGVAWPPKAIGETDDLCFELTAQFDLGKARSCGFRIETGDEEFLEVGYDIEPGALYVDRHHSGNVNFHPAFAGRHEAPVALTDGMVKVRVIVDRSTIEVFVNDGAAVISDRFFPTSTRPTIKAFAGDASAKITDVKLYKLKSIWNKSAE